MARVVKRRDIYLANLEGSIGSEIKKTRPVLIIQNDKGNLNSPTTIIAGMTSQIKKYYPVIVKVTSDETQLKQDGFVLLDQIRTVDKSRLIKKIGELHPYTMQKVNKAIRISLDCDRDSDLF